jgi:ATP-dependent Clp protease ATP-binding subunit ClpC
MWVKNRPRRDWVTVAVSVLGGSVFERFTGDARSVVVYAQEECRLLRHEHIGTEHLLLALMRDGDDATGQALQVAGARSVPARQRLEESRGRGKSGPHGHVPFTARAKQVLEQSLRVAQRHGQDHIGRPHLLRGLLAVRDCTGVQLLVDLGVDLDALAERADELALASQPGAERGTHPTTEPGVGSMRVEAGPRTMPPQALAALVEGLARERDRLEQGLRRYGRHEDGCEPEQGWSCGLDALLGTAASDPADPDQAGGPGL